jgi:glutamyl-tRNA(Gln) amidotransferase subunit D
LNLKASCNFAASSSANGVFVGMHENENDEFVAIHWGTRVRKNHTSKRNAFESIDSPIFARANEKEILLEQPSLPKSENDPEFSGRMKFSSSVALIKFYPGQSHLSLGHMAKDQKLSGLIIEGTGMGHVSSEIVKMLSSLIRDGLFVGMTSQCIWGHVDLNVYETGKDLLEAGVVPLGNMLAETAFVKLSWALGNFERSRVGEIMLRNISGEMSSRIVLSDVNKKEAASS